MVDLREYETVTGIALSEATAFALRRQLPWMGVSPSMAGLGLFDLKACEYVGVWESDDFSLRVLPKFDIAGLAHLLGFSREKARRWGQAEFRFSKESGVSELVVPGFLEAVERAFISGVAQGYHEVSDCLSTIRGRVDLGLQVKRSFGRMPPVHVTFQEYSQDILVNQLIKAAALRLRELGIANDQWHRQVVSIMAVLRDVSDVDYRPGEVPAAQLDRLTARYEDAVAISRMILGNSRFEIGRGEVRAKSFFVNMNYAFEDFLVKSLRRELRLSPAAFVHGSKGHHLNLDERKTISLEPDFAWWQGGSCLVVGDAKYLKPDLRAHQSNLYQAEAYAIAAGVRVSYLIYADKGEAQDLQVRNIDKVIKVRCLNLALEHAEVTRQLVRIAAEIRADAVSQVGATGPVTAA